MRPPIPLPDRDFLLRTFHYEPETGKLFWIGKASRKHHPGMEAGTSRAKGYPQVRMKGRNYQVHRLIWKMQTGRDPIEIDHRNGVPHDNRWVNLREATSSQNKMNKIVPNPHRGVHYITARRVWGAQIKANGQHLWLGCYPTPEAACAVYREKAKELHGAFAKKGSCECR